MGNLLVLFVFSAVFISGIFLLRKLFVISQNKLVRFFLLPLFALVHSFSLLPFIFYFISGTFSLPTDGIMSSPFFYSVFQFWIFSLALWILVYFILYRLIYLSFNKRLKAAIKNSVIPLFGKFFFEEGGQRPEQIASADKSKSANDAKNLSRRSFLAASFSVMPVFLFPTFYSSFLYTQQLNIQVRRQRIKSARFSFPNSQQPLQSSKSAWKGFRILQISDLHVGQIIHEKYLRKASEIINSVDADLFVITGDILDHDKRFLPLVKDFFASIKKFPLGSYAILGNHDLISGTEELITTMEALSIPMLRNEKVKIEYGGDHFYLIGLNYPPLREHMAGNRIEIAASYYRKAVQGLSEQDKKIVLNHHPGDFIRLRDFDIDLILSGHTHGGQVELADSQNRMSFIRLFHPYYRGLYAEKGSQLYVSAGLGHWFPVRINCPPEINILEFA